MGLRRRFRASVALRPWSFVAFLTKDMAREEKRFELKPVDDELERKVPVVRLESEETLQRPKLVRLGVPPEQVAVSKRLELSAKEPHESRTHQPGIDALIEIETVNPNFAEQSWGKKAAEQRHIPWGWFALMFLVLGAAAAWSLSGVKKGETQATETRGGAVSKIGSEATEEREATLLIGRIHEVTRKFFDATDIDQLAELCRQPERVKPLMQSLYQGKAIPRMPLVRSLSLQPMTLDHRANFWMETVELAGKEERSLLIEILENGEPRIDWETLVCHQPMNWDDFATRRPVGKSFDFRVYAMRDSFFSHEFSESAGWNSFRLTDREGEEALFGYVKADSDLSKEILTLIRKNRGQVTAMILRLTIPEGTQSRRGVVIEKLLSPRWLYLDPPDA